jgi:N6-adenosine-specific RNA methylase IME4
MIPFPNRKYNVIYADPCWQYNARNNTKTRFGGGAMGHYDTMTIEDIKSLPVQSICDDNCVLYLWVTFPKLQQGLDVIKAWGFEYKTLGFSWHKITKSGKLFFGIGSYTKSNCEVCLFATKGKVGIKKAPHKMVIQSNCVSSAINAEKEQHSKKPSEVRDRIVELWGDVPRIELFARQSVIGWDNWGNEV